MSDELDWGPPRPPRVGWAGGLLILLGIGQLSVLAAAAVLGADQLLGDRPAAIVAASVAGLLALQVLAAVGVLRLWRGFRALAMLLSIAGLALHGVALAPPADPPIVVAVSAAIAVVYVVVIALLARSGEAIR